MDRFLVDSRLRMCHPNGSQAKRFKLIVACQEIVKNGGDCINRATKRLPLYFYRCIRP